MTRTLYQEVVSIFPCGPLILFPLLPRLLGFANQPSDQAVLSVAVPKIRFV